MFHQNCNFCIESFNLFSTFFQVAPRHGRHCWVAGWGHTQEGSGIATRLQEVGVNLFDWNYCTTKSTYGTIVNKAVELCAGIPDGFDNGNLDGFVDGGKDACQVRVLKSTSF